MTVGLRARQVWRRDLARPNRTVGSNSAIVDKLNVNGHAGACPYRKRTLLRQSIPGMPDVSSLGDVNRIFRNAAAEIGDLFQRLSDRHQANVGARSESAFLDQICKVLDQVTGLFRQRLDLASHPSCPRDVNGIERDD